MKPIMLRIALLSSLAVLGGQSLIPTLDAQTVASTKNDKSSLPSAGTTEPPTTKSPVSPADPVITISGLCSGTGHPPSGKSTPCETTITKREFESLINSVDFGGQLIDRQARKRFAETYADLLLFERAAQNAGLSDTPQFKEILRWLSLRTMADMYYHMIQEKNKVPTPDQIDTYYKKHLSTFETVKLARILIPRDDYAMQDKSGEFDKKAQDAAKKAHEQAINGDDPDQIQKGVYAALGLTTVPPTDMGTKRREDFLPAEAEDVFRLVPGQVTQVEQEPRSYVIYKVVSRNSPAESQIRDQVSKKVKEEQTKSAIQAVRDSAKIDFNTEYFVSASPKPSQPSASISPASARH